MRNSTIIAKKKRCAICGDVTFIFSKGRCKSCATIQSTQARADKYEGVEDSESLQNLILDLDIYFSKYIRLKEANERGEVSCYTCGWKAHHTQLQCGHYAERGNMSTRFLEENCKPQCPNCNRKHETDESIFENALERENPGITSYLKKRAKEVYKYTLDELKSMIVEYRFKVKVLEKKINRNK